jgi:hypothetical protein
MKLSLKLMVISIIFMLAISSQAYAEAVKPTLVVDSMAGVKIEPGTFMPGDSGEISVTVLNSLKSVTPGESKTVTDTYTYGPGSSNGMTTPTHTQTTTTTSSEMPDAVLLKKVSLVSDGPVRVMSQSFENVGYLGPGDMARFTFLVTADSNAQNGVYYLKFIVDTGDENVYLNYPIRVEVDNTGVKMVLSEAPSGFSSSRKSVVFDVFNLRSNTISSVSVVPVGGDFVFKPVQEYVVGDIGAGEMYTVQFDVTARNLSYASDPQFKVVYKNGDNWHESGIMTVNGDKSAAAASGSVATDDTLLYVLGAVALLAVAIGGIFLYLRGKRAKK